MLKLLTTLLAYGKGARSKPRFLYLSLPSLPSTAGTVTFPYLFHTENTANPTFGTDSTSILRNRHLRNLMKQPEDSNPETLRKRSVHRCVVHARDNFNRGSSHKLKTFSSSVHPEQSLHTTRRTMAVIHGQIRTNLAGVCSGLRFPWELDSALLADL